MLRRGRRWRTGGGACLLGLVGTGVGCSGDSAGPTLPPCTAAGDSVVLAVGEYVSLDPIPDSGCAVFAANADPSTAEYLIVPQSAAGEPGRKSSFSLRGDTIVFPAPVAPALASEPEQSPAEQFHDRLRRAEATRDYGPALPPDGGQARRVPGAAAPIGPPRAKPLVGEQRTFSVLAELDLSRFQTVTATAWAVGQHIAIFIDNAAPANGLSGENLDSLRSVFDSRLYGADTAAFGRESDITGDSVVIVLMTPLVNQLVSKAECAQSGFIAGFFFGADIDPAFANDSRFNHTEIFYTLVADPFATVSCAHSALQVARLVPVTLIHEFQHMISYNQHVLVRGGDTEVLWLNEGLSHLAEELGGRTYAPGTPEYSRFIIGDLFNAYQFLDSTFRHFLLPTEGIGKLPERGAAWLFVRYLVDQYGAATTRALLETNQTGAANVAAVTGDFTQTVTRWALANWVSDLNVVGFTPPPELRYTSWSFRTTYASLHAQDPATFAKPFPLVPTVGVGDAVNLRGTLRAGSGQYHRVLQNPGDGGFTLVFGTGTGGPLPAMVVPRLNVIRIR
ncbi:MAG: hypothetical protein ACREL9_09115 [Gemmatimonadales bacterium]